MLRLTFITCHPALPAESRAALTLRLVADVMSVVHLIFNEGYSATAGFPDARPHQPDGRTVLLEAQDRRLWDQVLISGGVDALGRAQELGGPFARLAPRSVVEVNRAVVHGRAFGADAGLRVLDGLGPQALPRSHLLPAVRGDLLARADESS